MSVHEASAEHQAGNSLPTDRLPTTAILRCLDDVGIFNSLLHLTDGFGSCFGFSLCKDGWRSWRLNCAGVRGGICFQEGTVNYVIVCFGMQILLSHVSCFRRNVAR